MSDIIKLKRSAVAAAVPSSLEFGELAINYNVADGKLYYKNSAGTIVAFATGGGGGSVAEAASTAAFPATGTSSTLYIATDVGRLFRWTGSVYAEIGPVSGGSGEDARWDYFKPAAPTSVTAVAGNAQAVVSWTAPAIVVPPLTDFVVQFSSNSGSTWTTFVETTVAIGTQPANQTATSGNATFSVTATVSPSGTATYQWQKSDDAGTTFTAVAGATSATLSLTSLTNATDNNDQYRVVVSAVGATAVTSSAATLTVTQPPNAPTSLAATAGNGQLALTWTAPSAAGSSAITGYTVEYTPSGYAATTVNTGTTATSYTLTGLTNGISHSVRVRAVSAAGNGDYSTAVSGTPSAASVPGAVASLSSNPGTTNGSGTYNITGSDGCSQGFLVWTVPASDGGSAITGYKIAWSGGSLTVGSSFRRLNYTPSGWNGFGGAISVSADGTEITVRAINAVGEGPTTTAQVTYQDCN